MALTHRFLIPALWLSWLGYWLVAAHDAKATERAEARGARMVHTLPLAFAAWLLFAPALPGGVLAAQVAPYADALFWTGAALVACGLAFAIHARRFLGRNWSGIVTLKRDHELVRSGPYRWVRHPIYTGLLLALGGTAVALDEWRGLVAVPIAAYAFWRKLRVEESWMIERFGDAYRRFQAEVPMLIPNPLRRGGAQPS